MNIAAWGYDLRKPDSAWTENLTSIEEKLILDRQNVMHDDLETFVRLNDLWSCSKVCDILCMS